MTFDTTPPPLGLGTGERFTSPLRVYWFEQHFWVYDAQGYLCNIPAYTTSGHLLLSYLLEAESRPAPDPDRPHFRPAARELVHPGSALERETQVLAMKEAAKSGAFLHTKPKPAGQNLGLSLEDLGL